MPAKKTASKPTVQNPPNQKPTVRRFVAVVGGEAAGKRFEPGDVLDDLSAEDVAWLSECGAIRSAD